MATNTSITTWKTCRATKTYIHLYSIYIIGNLLVRYCDPISDNPYHELRCPNLKRVGSIMEKLKMKITSIPRYRTYPRDLQRFDPLSQIGSIEASFLGLFCNQAPLFLAGLGFFRDKGGDFFSLWEFVFFFTIRYHPLKAASRGQKVLLHCYIFDVAGMWWVEIL